MIDMPEDLWNKEKDINLMMCVDERRIKGHAKALKGDITPVQEYTIEQLHQDIKEEIADAINYLRITWQNIDKTFEHIKESGGK